MKPVENRLQAVLKDSSERTFEPLQVLIDCRESGINICPNGYGDFDSPSGFGAPIYLERHEGELRLIVWSDINDQEPTHVISLERAREDCRIGPTSDQASSLLI